MALGTIQETRRRVMVPFLEVALAGTTHAQIEKVGEVDEDGLSEMFSCVLSLDNAVWMQFDMLRDMRRAVGDLATVVNQDALEGARLRQALRYAERIRAEADKLMTALKVVAKEA